RQIGAEERLAELLSTIADGSADRQVALSLVLDAAAVKQDALADRPGAIERYARVLAEATDRELALTAARQLDGLLESEGPPERQLDVLERLADLESEPDRRSAALGAAARVAMSLHQPERAISAWRQRLAADASDAQALDGLCTALEAAERWPELVEALGLRARAAERDADARRDHVRIATLQASVIRDPAAAIDAWKDVRERYGADRESFEA